MIDDSKARGFRFVVCPYVPPNMRSAENMRKLGETLNKAGELARAAGMTLCYHNHAFEWAPLENTTIFDRMMAETDPKLVQVELDIMWVKVAGLDPVATIQKYSKRISLIHLKNVSEGLPQRFDERVPRDAFKEVGTGAIAIAPVLKAAAKAGVKGYFVEQDQTPATRSKASRAASTTSKRWISDPASINLVAGGACHEAAQSQSLGGGLGRRHCSPATLPGGRSAGLGRPFTDRQRRKGPSRQARLEDRERPLRIVLARCGCCHAEGCEHRRIPARCSPRHHHRPQQAFAERRHRRGHRRGNGFPHRPDHHP
jgi:hypothetical protein